MVLKDSRTKKELLAELEEAWERVNELRGMEKALQEQVAWRAEHLGQAELHKPPEDWYVRDCPICNEVYETIREAFLAARKLEGKVYGTVNAVPPNGTHPRCSDCDVLIGRGHTTESGKICASCRRAADDY